MKQLRCLRYGLLALFLLLPSSCKSAPTPGGPSTVTLKVFNWGDYIDPDVTALFTQETGIEVIYTMFEANEDMYTSIKASGDVSHDVVIPSDYMIRKMINEDMLRKIDMGNIPNHALIDDRFKNLAFDPQNEYSVPYMWGTVGIAYNTTMVEAPITSWTALWDEQYQKNIFMMDSVRDSLGVALKMLGYSMNTKNEAELQEAYNKLVEQKPLVLAYTGDEVKDKMIAGEAALAVVYAGDAITISDENPDIAYVIPQEGSNLFVDSMCILKTAENPEAAEAFINFMCSTPIATRNWEYINYSSPQKEVIAQMPEEFQNSPARNPSAEDLARCEVFEDLAQTTQYYEDLWTRLIGA
ncbi:MAG: spermidine/putrescine ABC transporter substrate-binding protein [Oscillospiraceae bacterium]|nr:spermidine/putrescine ABC transporter substrate-binding protein [Oscillospiraceae bacterium]